MNYRGRVKLVNGNEIIHSFQYTSREERSIIVNRWKHLYKESMDLYNIQIVPACLDEEVIKEKVLRGKLRAENRIEKMQQESREKFERPAAVYDNKTLYTY